MNISLTYQSFLLINIKADMFKLCNKIKVGYHWFTLIFSFDGQSFSEDFLAFKVYLSSYKRIDKLFMIPDYVVIL